MPVRLPPALDEAMLLHRVDGNRTLAVRLLREFYVSHADVVHRIRAAVHGKAGDDAFRLLHRTAGTAANLGLAPLAAAAAAAERVMHDALRRGVTIVALNLDTLEVRLDDALGAIQAAEKRLADPAPPPAAAPINAAHLSTLMGRLAEDLQAARLEALDRVAELASHLGAEAEPLSAAVARLDFTAAAGILHALQRQHGERR